MMKGVNRIDENPKKATLMAGGELCDVGIPISSEGGRAQE